MNITATWLVVGVQRIVRSIVSWYGGRLSTVVRHRNARFVLSTSGKNSHFVCLPGRRLSQQWDCVEVTYIRILPDSSMHRVDTFFLGRKSTAPGKRSHLPPQRRVMLRETGFYVIIIVYSQSISVLYSNAYTGGVTDEECLVSEIEACQEYNQKLVELSRLIEDTAPKMDTVKTLASEIKAIKLANPEIKAGADSPTLRKALKIAQQATEKYGVESSEAKLAWEDVEELAAAGTENSMGVNLLDECLVEEIEACEGLEELQRVLGKQ